MKLALAERILVLSLALGALTAAQPDRARGADTLDIGASLDTRVPRLQALPVQEAPESLLLSAPAEASFLGAPYSVGPVVTATTSLPEAEEEVAVDPLNSATLVAAISDFALRGGSNTTKYSVSMDHGATWSDRYVPLVNGFPATGDGLTWAFNSDPMVAIDKLGNVFLSDLYFNSGSGDNANGLYVSVGAFSSGSGVAFTAAQTYPILANTDPSTNLSEDKPWIAVDNGSSANAGNVYACWTHFVGNTPVAILFSRSTNHGASWSSAPVQVSSSSQSGAIQGCQVAAGPSGEVYVAYQLYLSGGTAKHYLARSTDGGQSFGAPVAVTPVFNRVSFRSTYRKDSFPALAVNPVSGSVYVLYPDTPNKTVGAEVEFVSIVSGVIHSPFVINDQSAGQQFMPAIAVDPNGVIHASWYDTRNSPNNSRFYDVYATYSTGTDGSSFAQNARVTPSLIDAGRSSFIGDYAGVAASGGEAHPVWTSGGFNNGQLQSARLTIP